MAVVASDWESAEAIPMKLRLRFFRYRDGATSSAVLVHHMRRIGPLRALATLLPGPLLVTSTTQMDIGQLLSSLRKLNHRHVKDSDVTPSVGSSPHQ